jgi:hypothetical protein
MHIQRKKDPPEFRETSKTKSIMTSTSALRSSFCCPDLFLDPGLAFFVAEDLFLNPRDASCFVHSTLLGPRMDFSFPANFVLISEAVFCTPLPFKISRCSREKAKTVLLMYQEIRGAHDSANLTNSCFGFIEFLLASVLTNSCFH